MPKTNTIMNSNYQRWAAGCCIALVLLCGRVMNPSVTIAGENNMDKTENMVNNIHWLGQATIKINFDDKTIYIDPYRIEKTDEADYIFITHGHQDHLSPGDIKRVLTDKTVIIAPESCKDALTGFKETKKLLVEPGKKGETNGIKFEAVPAYNIKKSRYHAKDNKWCGYILSLNGVRIYHAGDTERIPEMKEFNCDIALLPLGQTYTMNSVEEAADAAVDVQAKIAIPIHYGLYEGTTEDAVTFKNLLKDKLKVVILENE